MFIKFYGRVPNRTTINNIENPWLAGQQHSTVVQYSEIVYTTTAGDTPSA